MAPAPDEDAARAAERAKAHQELEAENAQKLQNYAWVDKAKGTVQIPIERAMELAIVELNSKKPTAAGPIAPAHRRLLDGIARNLTGGWPDSIARSFTSRGTSGLACGVTGRVARARRLAGSIRVACRSAHTG